MSQPPRESSDEALGRRLAAELPRHAAPPRLHAALRRAAAPPRQPVWLAATLGAAAAAMLLALVYVPLLPRAVPADPAGALVRSVVAEHARAAAWGARRLEPLPDALPWLAGESGIALDRVFTGDERLRLIGGEPVYLADRRGLALHYRDADGHLVTYTALVAPGLPLPARRVAVDRFKPALVEAAGRAVWVWKHGDVACFLTAPDGGQDVERLKDYFRRVRGATEPRLAG